MSCTAVHAYTTGLEQLTDTHTQLRAVVPAFSVEDYILTLHLCVQCLGSSLLPLKYCYSVCVYAVYVCMDLRGSPCVG